MKHIDWLSLLHHALTVVGFIMIPVLWLGLNAFKERTYLLNILKTWNDTRISGEPWGWWDRNYKA